MSIKETFKDVLEYRESKDAFLKRRQLAIQWAAFKAAINPSVARGCRVSTTACRAVLVQGIVGTSLTGDFSAAKQRTIAKKAGVSERTVTNAIKALRLMGLIFTKHNYKTDEFGRKRRISSYTVIAAFRKHFDKVKAYLQAYAGVAPVQAIVEKLARLSVTADSAAQLKSFNKAIEDFQFLDKKTGELLDSKDGFFRIRRETYLGMRGV